MRRLLKGSFIRPLMALLMIGFISLASALAPAAPTAQAASDKHVLMILLDDLDYKTFENLLNAGRLPNIKAELSNKGTNFTRAYVTNSLCCPARSTLLTGQYTHNHGVWSNAGINSVDTFDSGWEKFKEAPIQQRGINYLLTQNGYYTAWAGKFLNGFTYDQGAAPGWNYFAPVLNEYYQYGYRTLRWINGTLLENSINNTVYQPDQLAWEIANAANNRGGSPFFGVYAPTAPHVEWDIAPPPNDSALNWPSTTLAPNTSPYHITINTYADMWSLHIRGRLANSTIPDGTTFLPTSPSSQYGNPSRSVRNWNAAGQYWEPKSPAFDLPGAGTGAINENLATTNKPQWLRNGFGNVRSGTPPSYTYSASGPRPGIDTANYRRLQRLQFSRQEALIAVDDDVGYLINKLSNLGMLDKTMIIFTSDNGLQMGEHNLGEKMYAYEESIRVPLIIRDPNNLNTTATPWINDSLVLNTDIAPTIAQFTSTTPERWTGKWSGGSPDGRSLLPLTNPAFGTPFKRKQFLVEHKAVASRYWTNTAGTRHMSFYEVPHYNAMRTLNPEGENSLYTDYSYTASEYATPGVNNGTGLTSTPTHEYEFFNMHTQPNQIAGSVSFSADTYRQPKLTTLTSCAGTASCALAETGLHIFARRANGKILHRWFDGTWQEEEMQPPPSGATMDPAAVAWSAGRLDLFVRGGDGQLYHKWYANGTWQPSPIGGSNWEPWLTFSGGFASSPAVASWGEGRLDIFVRGNDGQIWTSWFTTQYGMGGWQARGKPTATIAAASDPAVVSWGQGRIDLFVRGTDNNIYTTWYAAAYGWKTGDWQLRGGPQGLGTARGSPAVASWGGNRLDLFVRDPNYAVSTTCYPCNASGGWADQWWHLGGYATSDPEAVSLAPGRIDLVVLGGNSVLYTQDYDIARPGWSSWASTGSPAVSGAALSP